MKGIKNNTQKETTSKHFHITCRPSHIRFFTGWLFLGIIMMLLNATIWPEVSTDANIRWFYQVATLWLTLINKICEFIFPYLQNVGNWLVNAAIWLINLVVNIYEWGVANWQPVLTFIIEIFSIIGAIFTFLFKIWIYTIILFLLFFAVYIIVLIVTYFIDKDKANELCKEFRTEVLDEIVKMFNQLLKIWKKDTLEEENNHNDAE